LLFSAALLRATIPSGILLVILVSITVEGLLLTVFGIHLFISNVSNAKVDFLTLKERSTLSFSVYSLFPILGPLLQGFEDPGG